MDDTGQHDKQEMILDVLTTIRDDLEIIKTDLHTVHELQKSFAERLSLVERFCVERPLRSSPSTPAPRLVGKSEG
jgi:hypothetical protein